MLAVSSSTAGTLHWFNRYDECCKYPTAIVVEGTVNLRGEYWERSLHPSEARYKKAFGEWVPDGYETDLEEMHRTVATNALETKFNAS